MGTAQPSGHEAECLAWMRRVSSAAIRCLLDRHPTVLAGGLPAVLCDDNLQSLVCGA
jgi:hypothetical protein